MFEAFCRDRVDTVDVRVNVVTGGSGPACYCCTAAASVPGSHFFPELRPVETAAALRSFVTGVTPTGAGS